MVWLERKGRAIAIGVWVLTGVFAWGVPLAAEETALDRYVAKPDPTYSWKVVRTTKTNQATHFLVDMKSQTWRTGKDVNHTVWQHWVSVIKPTKVTSKTAFLFIAGGRNGGGPPRENDDLVQKIAAATGSVVVELKMVPNQFLVFHHDGVGRKEDDLIGYTWNQYLTTGDETWPARLPMVKSVVRAMDCVQELLGSQQGGHVPIENFVVAGGSKRGWTTWCTAAVDKRVLAAVPMVIDVLNVNANMQHQVESYGFYSWALSEYFDHNILQRFHDPKLKQLYAIEDPYSYRDRLTMPKYVVNSTGDEIFVPDSSQFYFGDLKAEKLLRYVPNSDHSLAGTDAEESIVAYYQSILMGIPRPHYTWSFEADGGIRVKTTGVPKRVRLWQAHNPNARDFRLLSIGKAYTDSVLESQGEGVFVGKIPPPEKGWTAFFVELTYDLGTTFPLKVTTGVRVLPDTLPYPKLDPGKARLEVRPRSN